MCYCVCVVVCCVVVCCAVVCCVVVCCVVVMYSVMCLVLCLVSCALCVLCSYLPLVFLRKTRKSKQNWCSEATVTSVPNTRYKCMNTMCVCVCVTFVPIIQGTNE